MPVKVTRDSKDAVAFDSAERRSTKGALSLQDGNMCHISVCILTMRETYTGKEQLQNIWSWHRTFSAAIQSTSYVR
jgi:hypothetical protein